MTVPKVEYISPDDLNPDERNARTHSRKQIRQIAASIRTFDFTNPTLIDSQAVILPRLGRVAAVVHLAMETIPCVRIETMTPAQKRAGSLYRSKRSLLEWER